VWMGVESGSQKILSAMDKGTHVDQIGIARENLRNEGIRACYFLQFGYPGENWQDIQKTIALVQQTRPDDIGVSVSYPLPGTRFFDQVRAQLGKKTNWSDSEDLSMMFRGAYTDEFYRALHDALHTQVDTWHSRHNERTRIRQNQEYAGPGVDQMWARVIQLEKTCRNPDPTVLEVLSTDSLVQLQPASGFAHGCSSNDGSGND
jgi:anaerobic magnesium-protoporphyrin IX monomethyl ester cyclase